MRPQDIAWGRRQWDSTPVCVHTNPTSRVMVHAMLPTGITVCGHKYLQTAILAALDPLAAQCTGCIVQLKKAASAAGRGLESQLLSKLDDRVLDTGNPYPNQLGGSR